MKILSICITLILMAFPLLAVEPSNTIKMGDFDKTFQGFSLSTGKLVTVDMKDGLQREVDFIFDMPNGLGMNNSELAPVFKGTAGIIDLGPVSLEEESDFPEEEFNIFLDPELIIPGNTYIIKTSDEDHYGKLHILNFDRENETLEFTWMYFEK